MSVIFPPAILGPEMAAPILWAPGNFWFFLLENPHADKIPHFRGELVFVWKGGWKCQFYFYGRGDFSEKTLSMIFMARARDWALFCPTSRAQEIRRFWSCMTCLKPNLLYNRLNLAKSRKNCHKFSKCLKGKRESRQKLTNDGPDNFAQKMGQNNTWEGIRISEIIPAN